MKRPTASQHSAGTQPGDAASRLDAWLPRIAWGVAAAMVVLLGVVALWQAGLLPAGQTAAANPPALASAPLSSGAAAEVALQAFQPEMGAQALVRYANPHTAIPTDRPPEYFHEYTVSTGDALFSIAVDNKIKPETLLWANYATLNDNPDMLSIGQSLMIPPTDGVLYQWKEGDTLQDVAARFNVTPEDITAWPGNHLDMTNPVISTGQWIMAPGGHREFRSWVVPMVFRPKSGVLKNILGPGGCDVNGGAVGGAFVWPAANHSLSGNDFWSGHMGIDIAAGLGAAVYAADTGVVVYAGAIGGGYGNMIMIDHGTGYQTLYAHLSNISVRCGQNVSRGQVIGAAGSTGNSTGPHLHFEVRYMGGFINPWKVLP